MCLRKCLILLWIFGHNVLSAQLPDSLSTIAPRVIFSSDENMELNNSRIISELDTMSHPELRISGYISTYFAHYDDDTETNDFVQFPTLAPRNDQFSLNMALISMEYKS